MDLGEARTADGEGPARGDEGGQLGGAPQSTLGLLEVLCRTGVIPNFTVIPPSAMAQSLWKILASGKFNHDIAATLANVGIAIGAAMIAGVAFATALQSWPAARRVFDPLFATYYAVPMYAFYPLLLVIFGLGDFPQIAIGFLLAVMAVIINTLNGLDRVPAVLLKTAYRRTAEVTNVRQ